MITMSIYREPWLTLTSEFLNPITVAPESIFVQSTPGCIMIGVSNADVDASMEQKNSIPTNRHRLTKAGALKSKKEVRRKRTSSLLTFNFVLVANQWDEALCIFRPF